MNQTADVTRFCAIEGRLCEKHIPYQGTNTFFFTYPSGDYWRDFSEKLVDELMDQGVLGQRWEDTIGNDSSFRRTLHCGRIRRICAWADERTGSGGNTAFHLPIG